MATTLPSLAIDPAPLFDLSPYLYMHRQHQFCWQ